MGAVAVPSSSTPWNVSFKLGWPTVPDKPEKEMMGVPVERRESPKFQWEFPVTLSCVADQGDGSR